MHHVSESGLRIADCSSIGTCGGLWLEAHAAAGAPYAKDVSEQARATGRAHLDASLYAGKAAVLARMLDALQLQEGEDDTVRVSLGWRGFGVVCWEALVGVCAGAGMRRCGCG